MIKNILCPVDRSPSSLQAFSYAIALARWQGARLNLMEVIEPALTVDGSVPKAARAALERDLRRTLTARRASDLRVEILMRSGNVVQEILAQAKASRVDLVVIGSHGRGGVQRLVLGSVAEKVLRLATCPVLTVRKGVRAARRSRPRTILCATDFSAAGNRAVAYAGRLAQEAGARLIVMHAIDWQFAYGVTSSVVFALRKRMASSAREKLLRLISRVRSEGPAAQAVVSTGKPSAAILNLARARSVDLIVLGVSGRGATDVALLGSTTHQVIREGTWPVLTVRTGRR